ncbi:GNAT family N-acetyltransferase [Sanguibacter sp. 25GB23B1]|uniref:GNAT family N-acetyltransferase n=1 Tax=unclassified Sanguibacter TaxID=2645534 RepID=UPI0032AF60CD
MTHPHDGTVESRQPPTITLVRLGIDTITALAAGDRAGAGRSSRLPISSYLADDRALWAWQLAVAADLDPVEQSRWLACAVLDETDWRVVGHAGFHGPPREGMVEIGYSIDLVHRRRGYGRAVVSALLDEARACPDVTRVRASINRSNTASFATISGFRFVAVGSRAVDGGEEVILERRSV